ncbi:MAG: hypothetical protein C0487_02055 [Leptothrix sp. (in: Bacteria)]|nr:hypothetical protein [Leptothrix sp. (in: b-proteobacteria)]
MSMRDIHIALQFGNIKHFNEGLSEFSRQLALQYAGQARQLNEERRWHFHFILPKQWHGMFGDEVTYHDVTDRMRWRHHFEVPLDVWHGLHQHMRYRPPVNSRRNVITVHDLNHLYAKTGLSLWWQNLRLKRHLGRAHQLVAISHFAATDLAAHLLGNAPVTVIHNGAADLSQTRQESIPALGTQSFMLHISRMSPAKNVESLLDMAACWPEQALVLAGPKSSESERHAQRIAELGLRHVRIINDVSEAQKSWLYAHCSAFLFPSLTEGFGLPPIEAMFFGKPVIVARRSCLPEICGDGAAYWDDFDPQGMRRVIEQQLAQHAQAPAIQAEHVRGQARRYAWPRAAASYLAIYQERQQGA